MNISIGENSRNKKNPFEYIVPPPSRGSEQLFQFGILVFSGKKNFYMTVFLGDRRITEKCSVYHFSFTICCFLFCSVFLLHLERQRCTIEKVLRCQKTSKTDAFDHYIENQKWCDKRCFMVDKRCFIKNSYFVYRQ